MTPGPDTLPVVGVDAATDQLGTTLRPPNVGSVGDAEAATPGASTAQALRDTGRAVRGGWCGSAVRLASHVVVWMTCWYPAVVLMVHGWRPVRDDAMISLGAWRVLSLSSPLVGVWSEASQTSHTFYDLGPMLLWLLALPVHLEAGQGSLWGAALCCAVVLSLAVEACWGAGGWLACTAPALVTVDLAWRTGVTTNLVWNPNIGLVFLLATVALCWAVAAGHYRWWPVAVATGSIAAQCHFIFVVPAGALVLGAPGVAWLLGTRPSRRAAVVGLAVGALCWWPTVVQQLTGHPGNLSLVWASSSSRPAAGVTLGLRSLAAAADPSPIWLRPFPVLLAAANDMPRYLARYSSTWGALVLVLLLLVGAAAWRSRRCRLAALSAMAFLLSLGVVISFSLLPRGQLGVSGYLSVWLWMLGALLWVVALWSVVAIVGTVVRHAFSLRNRRSRRHRVAGGWRSMPIWPAMGFVALATLAVLALEPVHSQAESMVKQVDVDAPTNARITAAVEHVVPRSASFVMSVQPSSWKTTGGWGSYVVDGVGVEYALTSQGWHPYLEPGLLARISRSSAPPGARLAHVVVHLRTPSGTVAMISVRPASSATPKS